MIAVIFEVAPADGCEPHYLDVATALRPQLEEIDGFISVERFRSIALLHRAAQSRGREVLFSDYRIRIAGVIRDYGMTERREQAPGDSTAYHGTAP